MLRLADTSIRLYRKKDGKASFRLRSYLLVKTNVGFRLSAYLKHISCNLTLSSGEVVVFDQVSFTEDLTCKYEMETMVHGFWASAIADMPVIKDTVARLRVDYHLSFTGHPSETPAFFEAVVPLIRRASLRDSVVQSVGRNGL